MLLLTYSNISPAHAAACRYDGRPHWGKCADRSFTHAAPGCSSIAEKYGSRLQSMLQLQQQYDPQKMFEPELFVKMLSQQETKRPGCALDRTCYCRWAP
jgi:hypothetical protein